MAVYCHPAYLTYMQNAAASAAKLLQSCPTLCDPIDSSPPGSPIPGILQARMGCHCLLWASEHTRPLNQNIGLNSTKRLLQTNEY